MNPSEKALINTALAYAKRFAYVGFVLGLIYSVGGALYDISTTGELNAGSYLAFLALLGMPIILAILGFAIGLLLATIKDYQGS